MARCKHEFRASSEPMWWKGPKMLAFCTKCGRMVPEDALHVLVQARSRKSAKPWILLDQLPPRGKPVLNMSDLPSLE